MKKGDEDDEDDPENDYYPENDIEMKQTGEMLASTTDDRTSAVCFLFFKKKTSFKYINELIFFVYFSIYEINK